ncbi:MAG: ParB/RepB/Spo0J family partition protein [Rickettsiales bacterium]
MNKSRGLGRGLSALLGENIELERQNETGFINLFINDIEANPNQPRTIFNSENLEELEDSISLNGVLQPILVRPIRDNKYQIIAGERRWRAVKKLGLAEIPAIIKNISDKETLELAIIENIQRANLNPLEEAQSYQKLISEYQYTQEKVAQIVSKSRSHIANLLRLLNLPKAIKEYLKEELLSLGHAKLLANNSHNNEELAELVVKSKLSVRDLENLIKKNNSSSNSPKTNKEENNNKIKLSIQDEDQKIVENLLSSQLNMPVKIEPLAHGGGRVVINYVSLDELDDLLHKLNSYY